LLVCLVVVQASCLPNAQGLCAGRMPAPQKRNLPWWFRARSKMESSSGRDTPIQLPVFYSGYGPMIQ